MSKRKFIYVPFTEEQTAALNRYQQSGAFHPFTCGNDDCPGEIKTLTITEEDARRMNIPMHFVGSRSHLSHATLIATVGGWTCPECDYTQGWAWVWMADDKVLAELIAR